jgi:serine/threonine-protein kinase RsbW
MTYTTQLMMKLKSCPSNIAQVEQFVNDITHTFQINNELRGNVLISLTEAVNNAILHGNKCDTSKSIEVEAKKISGKIYFTVNDQGTGFDPASVSDPTRQEYLTTCGGRGLFLMRNLCDQVVFNQRGNRVRMEFSI